MWSRTSSLHIPGYLISPLTGWSTKIIHELGRFMRLLLLNINYLRHHFLSKSCRKTLWILNTLPNGVIPYNNTWIEAFLRLLLLNINYLRHHFLSKSCRKTLWILNTLPNGVIPYNNTWIEAFLRLLLLNINYLRYHFFLSKPRRKTAH